MKNIVFSVIIMLAASSANAATTTVIKYIDRFIPVSTTISREEARKISDFLAEKGFEYSFEATKKGTELTFKSIWKSDEEKEIRFFCEKNENPLVKTYEQEVIYKAHLEASLRTTILIGFDGKITVTRNKYFQLVGEYVNNGEKPIHWWGGGYLESFRQNRGQVLSQLQKELEEKELLLSPKKEEQEVINFIKEVIK